MRIFFLWQQNATISLNTPKDEAMLNWSHSLITQAHEAIANSNHSICSGLKIDWQESTKLFWVEFSPPKFSLKEGEELPPNTLGMFYVNKKELLEFCILLIDRIEDGEPLGWRSLIDLSQFLESAAINSAIYLLVDNDQVTVDALPAECEAGGYVLQTLRERIRINPNFIVVTLNEYSGNFVTLGSFSEPKDTPAALAIFSEAIHSEIEYDFSGYFENKEGKLEQFLLCKEHGADAELATASFEYALSYTCWLPAIPEALQYFGDFSQGLYYRLLEEKMNITFAQAAIKWMKQIAKIIRSDEYSYSDVKDDWRRAKILIKKIVGNK